MNAELTIVVPTYNERENVIQLIDSLQLVLANESWEVIFVDDDSGDNTAALVREIARSDSRVRCIHRLKRRGLASASIEGILASASPYVCIMDADLQHDEKILPRMLEAIRTGQFELIIGRRYIRTGSVGNLARYRTIISRLATLLGQQLLSNKIQDPMSGFFMLRRDYFEQIMHELSGKGFKILLDILASTRAPVRYLEIPYTMRNRLHGTSKLDSGVIWDFFALMLDKMLGRLLPVRFFMFVTVGLMGVLVHMLSLWSIYRLIGGEFLLAQITGTYLAMTSNYTLNNLFTYRDVKLKGRAFFRGLFSFYIYCSFGAFINLVLSEYLFEQDFPWWLAGILGAVSGSVWNYAVTAAFIWKVERP